MGVLRKIADQPCPADFSQSSDCGEGLGDEEAKACARADQKAIEHVTTEDYECTHVCGGRRKSRRGVASKEEESSTGRGKANGEEETREENVELSWGSLWRCRERLRLAAEENLAQALGAQPLRSLGWSPIEKFADSSTFGQGEPP